MTRTRTAGRCEASRGPAKRPHHRQVVWHRTGWGHHGVTGTPAVPGEQGRLPHAFLARPGSAGSPGPAPALPLWRGPSHLGVGGGEPGRCPHHLPLGALGKVSSPCRRTATIVRFSAVPRPVLAPSTRPSSPARTPALTSSSPPPGSSPHPPRGPPGEPPFLVDSRDLLQTRCLNPKDGPRRCESRAPNGSAGGNLLCVFVSS